MTKTRWLILTALPGCMHTVTTSLRPDQVGTRYATMSAYMATRSAAPGGTWTEQTPGAIRHDAILDDATLAKIDGGETCVDVTLRTEVAHDEPLSQYQLALTLDGQARRAVVDDERVSVYDYAYTGEREVASIEGVAASEYVGMSITAPGETIFRVIERHGRVCAGSAGAHEIALAIVHPSWDVASYSYRLDFDWRLE